MMATVVAEQARLARAMTLIGHRFENPSLLLQALTHRSYCNEHTHTTEHNERLELLGDAVLSLVVVEQLLADMPKATEGDVTEQRARRVSTVALAAAAKRTGLVGLLRTGRGMHNDSSSAVAADVVEAVLGAAYLDGGLTAARVVVAMLLPEDQVPIVTPRLHAKRQLQERLQHLFGRAPTYQCERTSAPDAAPLFAATAHFDDDTLGQGSGASKKDATESAAWQAWQSLLPLDDDALRARWSRARS
jgi:ribonuclease III